MAVRAGGRRLGVQVLLLGLLVAAPHSVTAQDEDGGVGCPMEVTVPWTYAEEVKVDLSESVKFDDLGNPLALSTICTCPAAPDDAAMSTVCTCEGPKQDDCDTYARMLAVVMLTAEKFFGVFMHMGELEDKYHIQNVAFFLVLGSALVWTGFIMIMYSEIKAVLIVRERDERDRLLHGNYLKRNESKMREMNASEEAMLVPRPYLTMIGAVLLWLGFLAQLLPFCNILALIFPGLEFFKGMCWLFVIMVTLVIGAATVLLLVGLIWSCTRGWAALVLVTLGLLGECMVFGGILPIILWLVLSVAILYLYFKWAPDYYEETEGDRREWLQDLGNWYKMSAQVDDWMVAASQQGQTLGNEGLGFVKAVPGGSNVIDAVAPSIGRPDSTGSAGSRDVPSGGI